MLPLAFLLLLASSAAPPPQDDGDEPPKAAGPQQPPKGDDDDDEGKAQPVTNVSITGRKLDVARTQINPELGATVYSLGNDAIEDRPGGETSSMAGMLTQTPGVVFSGDVLTIRGSQDIQVRINDVIVPEAVSDPADHLSVRLAQTTRVMTGTLPAQYGFVPAGVISVTTKNGLYRHGGELELYAGTQGFTEPAIEWAGDVLGTSLFASGSLETGRTEIADLAGNRTRDRRHEVEGLAFADRIIDSDDRVSLVVGGSQERHKIGETSLPAGTEDSGDRYVVGTFQHTAGGFSLQSSLFYGTGNSDASFVQSSRERQSTVGTQIDSSYDIGGGHTFRAGLLASHSVAHEMEGGTSTFDGSRNAIGLYVQDEWKLGNDLTFNPGVRGDWLTGFDHAAHVEPRASLVWNAPGGATAHIGYARYAAAPPLDRETASASLPNEHDDYIDAGLQYRIGVVTLGADAYVRSARNFLTEHSVIGSAIAEPFAFERAKFRGVELSATYSTKALSAWANLAISQGRGRSIIDNSAIFAPATIAASNGHWIALASDRPVSGSTGVTWRSGKLALSTTIAGSSGAVRSLSLGEPNDARDHAYATIGLSAVYHAGLGGRLSDFRVDVQNITNARYLTNDAANLEGGWTRWGMGRSITVGIEQGF